MSALADARADLRDLLDSAIEDVQIFSIIPERAPAPLLAVGPGDPYVEYEGAVLGGMRVRLMVTVVAAAGSNDVQADALDDLIEAVVNAVDAESPDWVVERVQRPGQHPLNGQSHLGANVIVLTEV